MKYLIFLALIINSLLASDNYNTKTDVAPVNNEQNITVNPTFLLECK